MAVGVTVIGPIADAAKIVTRVGDDLVDAAGNIYKKLDGSDTFTDINGNSFKLDNNGDLVRVEMPDVSRTLNFDNATTTTVSGQVDPSDIKFAQDSISQNFRDGSSVDDLISGLKNGTIDPNSIPPIRVFEVDNQLVTLDNRRLYAYQKAGITINVQPATAAEIANDSFKFTTKNGGTEIEVRGK